MKKSVSLLLFFLIGIFSIEAETINSIAQGKDIIENAIQLFSDTKFQEGVDTLKPYWPQSPVMIDNLVVQTKGQWPTVEENYGPKLGIEYLNTLTVGKSLAKIIYLVRFEKYALKFETTLYKSKDGWIIVSFNFDDKLQNLF